MSSDKNEDTQRYGGPGSSHQDREHPGKDKMETGHKHGGGHPGSQKEKDVPGHKDKQDKEE